MRIKIDAESAGAVFRRLRKAKGISQIEVAELANVNKTTVSNFELGKYGASLYTLGNMLDAIGYGLEVAEKCSH